MANFSTFLYWLMGIFRACFWTFTLFCFVIFCWQGIARIWHNTGLCTMSLNAELAEDNTVFGLLFTVTLFYIVSGLKGYLKLP